MEENKKEYLSLMSEIIAKMAVVFGPDIAILKAKSVAGLSVDNNGNVTDIKGDTVQTAKELVDFYMELSDQATKNAIDLIFAKYPQIKKIWR
jgi:hypothetical protein